MLFGMSMKRVTITVPDDVAERLESVDNVSAYFVEAARATDTKLRTERLLHAAEGDVSPEQRAEVRARVRAQFAQSEQRRAERRLQDAQADMKRADQRAAAAGQARPSA
jgi:hypothetical protein